MWTPVTSLETETFYNSINIIIKTLPLKVISYGYTSNQIDHGLYFSYICLLV